MGRPIPDPVEETEHGDDCLACWPAGKTPKFCTATFHDIETCPGEPAPPNNIPFMLTQQPDSACHFRLDTSWNGMDIRISHLASWPAGGGFVSELLLFALNPPGVFWFLSRSDPCALNFENWYEDCIAHSGKFGRGYVQFVVPHVIIMLCSHYHMVMQTKRLYEIREVAMDHKLVRIASKRDATCCYFYVDDQDLELVDWGA